MSAAQRPAEVQNNTARKPLGGQFYLEKREVDTIFGKDAVWFLCASGGRVLSENWTDALADDFVTALERPAPAQGVEELVKICHDALEGEPTDWHRAVLDLLENLGEDPRENGSNKFLITSFMAGREARLVKALERIRDIDEADCAKYVAIADGIAVNALVEVENDHL